MKLNIYVYKNNTLEATANPFYESEEPEKVKTQLTRSVMMKKEDEIAHLVNTELFFLGTYDDESMRFDLESSPRLLIDFNQALDRRKVRLAILAEAQRLREKKEGSVDGES